MKSRHSLLKKHTYPLKKIMFRIEHFLLAVLAMLVVLPMSAHAMFKAEKTTAYSNVGEIQESALNDDACVKYQIFYDDSDRPDQPVTVTYKVTGVRTGGADGFGGLFEPDFEILEQSNMGERLSLGGEFRNTGTVELSAANNWAEELTLCALVDNLVEDTKLWGIGVESAEYSGIVGDLSKLTVDGAVQSVDVREMAARFVLDAKDNLIDGRRNLSSSPSDLREWAGMPKNLEQFGKAIEKMESSLVRVGTVLEGQASAGLGKVRAIIEQEQSQGGDFMNNFASPMEWTISVQQGDGFATLGEDFVIVSRRQLLDKAGFGNGRVVRFEPENPAPEANGVDGNVNTPGPVLNTVKGTVLLHSASNAPVPCDGVASCVRYADIWVVPLHDSKPEEDEVIRIYLNNVMVNPVGSLTSQTLYNLPGGSVQNAPAWTIYERTLVDDDGDSDGDGISDGLEKAMGTDKDNCQDPWVSACVDNDADGIHDGPEESDGAKDNDGDGLVNALEEALGSNKDDVDSDSSQTPENEEDNGTHDDNEDFDGDGLTNGEEAVLGSNPLHCGSPYLTGCNGTPNDEDVDLDGDGSSGADSDGDGLPDALEEGVTQSDPLLPNGVDSDSSASDSDESGNGTPDNEEDFDGDGLTNEMEVKLGTNPMDCNDPLDGVCDFINDPATGVNPNADGDNDGLTNAEEAAMGFVPTDDDSDATKSPDGQNEIGNGTEDGDEDSDGDGISNEDEFANGSDPLDCTDPSQFGCDTDGDGDSDEDGIPDSVEKSAVDQDPDGDGLPNHLDLDSDGDGIPDSFEADKLAGNQAANSPVDSDGDNTPDYLDTDSDDDGVKDIAEGHNIVQREEKPDGKDTDGDGIDDAFENAGTPPNTDGTDNPNYADPDDDNDGLETSEEVPTGFGTNPYSDNSDSSKTPAVDESTTTETDGDEDFDNDGTLNKDEASPAAAFDCAAPNASGCSGGGTSTTVTLSCEDVTLKANEEADCTISFDKVLSADVDIPLTISGDGVGDVETISATQMGTQNSDEISFKITADSSISADSQVTVALGTLPSGFVKGQQSEDTVSLDDGVGSQTPVNISRALSCDDAQEGEDIICSIVLSDDPSQAVDVPISTGGSGDTSESGDVDLTNLSPLTLDPSDSDASDGTSYNPATNTFTFTIPTDADTDTDDETVRINFGPITDSADLQVLNIPAPLASNASTTVEIAEVTAPDFFPSLNAYETNIRGVYPDGKKFSFDIIISEDNKGTPDGSDIIVEVPKNSRVIDLELDQSLTANDYGDPVQNGDWEMIDINHLDVYRFRYKGTGFVRDGVSTIYITAKLKVELGDRGKFPLTATIVTGSGGETDNSNNVDNDTISYGG